MTVNLRARPHDSDQDLKFELVAVEPLLFVFAFLPTGELDNMVAGGQDRCTTPGVLLACLLVCARLFGVLPLTAGLRLSLRLFAGLVCGLSSGGLVCVRLICVRLLISVALIAWL